MDRETKFNQRVKQYSKGNASTCVILQSTAEHFNSSHSWDVVKMYVCKVNASCKTKTRRDGGSLKEILATWTTLTI